MRYTGIGFGLAALLCACTAKTTNNTTSMNPVTGGPQAGTGVVNPTGTGTGGVNGTVTNPQGGTGAAGTAVPSGTGGKVGGAGTSSTPGTGGMGATAGTGSGGTPAGTGGTASGTGGAAAAGETVMGCGTTKLLKPSDDVSQPGPWPVGVKTVHVPITGGMITAEVWYPAPVGSQGSTAKVTYDLGQWTADPQPIMDADKVIANCDCYRDLPVDTSYGPYPGVIFIHGTGSFRAASLSTMTQWASRGFIVVAADHPGLFLTDVLACTSTGISQNLGRDVDAMIDGMTNKTGDFAFLGSSIDMSRIALSGHSAGAQGAAQLSNRPNVQLDMPFADYGGQPVSGSAMVKSVLILSGMSDSVVNYSSDQAAYGASPSPKRLVGITGADHIDVTDLCWLKSSKGETGIQVAADYAVCGGGTVAGLAVIAQCGTIDPKLGSQITNYVSTAALEETLHCMNRDAAFSGLQAKYPAVGDFQHDP